MTTNLKALFDAIEDVELPAGVYDELPTPRAAGIIAAALDSAGFVKNLVIETEDEADALPLGAVLLTEQGGIWHRLTESPSGCDWYEPGKPIAVPSASLTYPATVIASTDL
jgi:hypothetical protein